ncbi:(2Fe-2S) ferredoxin domain-containing protein [Rubrobacter indicoceani]|uniref:(2Fe-2S) ferredoxin domain-containing protein n=1 Tax=Rubrobacter indicoceani TaxID=2051957 RepID=UPI0013C47170|nr:(2Fe-2S) ferredoxin domain-containing protein [Rubrobacter indicoceani]
MAKGAKLASKRVKVRGYESHVLVCSGGSCKKRGAKDVRKTLKDEVKDAGLGRDVRLDSVGCLGLCKHGPNAVVYPEGTWYVGVSERDVPAIVEEHLSCGRPVERLSADFR